ncbi:uncharacterized protein LOC111407840 [Olea europaea var. sylvestris]|uniref:uncharacterized protein LOC111407840 n=1 Tax=Olea europaea var. sylvestris TaxID=158386 RepID=UPI000C1CF4CC|nr:uncharacterized protein LOC111407840 [Olea europaea var. sylvestris]
MKFLRGLNDTYNGLKAQIPLIKPFLRLNEVYSIIQQEEKRRQISTDCSLDKTMALLAKGNLDVRTQNQSSQKKDRYYCTYCKIAGHSLKRCFKANPNKPACSYFQMPGHTVGKCFELHGYPSGHKSEGRNKPSTSFANQITALMPLVQEQDLLTWKMTGIGEVKQ